MSFNKAMLFAALFAAIATGCSPEAPEPATPQPQNVPSDQEAQELANALVEALGRGDFTAACKDFDTTMQRAMPVSKMEEVWQQLCTQQGAFQKTLGTQVDPLQGYEAVLVTCQFEKARLDIQVTVNDAGQVAGLFVRPANP